MSSRLTSSADALKLWPRDNNDMVIGKHVALEQLKETHADDLFPSVGGEAQARLWDYMPSGPYYELEDFRSYIRNCTASKDVCFWAVKDRKTGKIVGHTSFLRIDPSNAVVEIGHIMYAPSLQKTAAATEVWYLLADRAFASGFRRLEWKCNAANEPSRRAALRFGHTCEGVFRQHMIVKGKNRDTAWYSILDGEWPLLKRALLRWLDESNFGEDGKQKLGLVAVRAKEASV